MTPTITHQRASFVAGLRELADYIEATPDLPIPSHNSRTAIAPHLSGSDAEDRAEVDRIAAILDASPTTTRGDHYKVSRQFSGGITYEAVAITARAMAQWHAMTSYRGAVEPAESLIGGGR